MKIEELIDQVYSAHNQEDDDSLSAFVSEAVDSRKDRRERNRGSSA